MSFAVDAQGQGLTASTAYRPLSPPPAAHRGRWAALITTLLLGISTGSTAQDIAPPSAVPSTTSRPAIPTAKAANVIQIDIPLLIDRLNLGSVPAFISSLGDLQAVNGTAFIKLVDRFFLPEKLAAIQRHIGPGNKLTLADIRAEGVTFTYDTSRVEASISIPLVMRSTQSLSLTQAYGPASGEITGPAAVSGYVNFLVGKTYLSEGLGRRPTVVDFDTATNILGNTFEGIITHYDSGAIRWQRSDFRLVHDEPDSRTRYSFGDLSYGLDGFQSFQRAGGFAIARNFGLQPYRTSAPIGQTQLELDRASQVDVLVNGQKTQVLNLQPGRYNVRDLPLSSGTNDITLRVTDEVGRVNIIRFPFVFDATLLGEGEQDFSYVIGAPAQTTAMGRS